MRTTLLFIIFMTVQIMVIHAQMDERFYHPTKDLNPIEWTDYEELKFGIDTDTLYGMLLKPIAKPKATIFYFHGAGGNSTYYLPLSLILVKKEFQVVMIDFRGYGKSSGTPTHNNISSDGQKVFDVLLQRPDITSTPIIIYGISMGSQIATQLTKNNQEKIHGLVLEGAISSFKDIAIHYAPEHKEFLQTNYTSPYSAEEDVKAIDNIPKLFIHSREDKDVPYAHSEILFKNASEPKEFITFKGEHLYGLKYKKEEILQVLVSMSEREKF